MPVVAGESRQLRCRRVTALPSEPSHGRARLPAVAALSLRTRRQQQRIGGVCLKGLRAPSSSLLPWMGQRIDYLDDPGAPKANSLVPSVNVGVVNDQRQILLIRRTDNQHWALPGGAMDVGETIAEAAVRETREETGVECEVVRVVGIYTNPRHVILYTSNWEVRQECSVVFAARATGGEPRPSSESSDVRWVPADEIDRYPMHPSMRQRVERLLENRREPYIG